jgi:phospholipid/cholesterol/gamma-HCH transport system substrate-binding protein
VKRGLALLVIASVASSGCALLGGGGDSYAVTVYFPRAVSLYESSQVRVLGLPAGTVTDIVVEGDRVRVDLDMDSSVPVPVDVRAALVPQSLIGERYVQLVPAWVEGEEKLQDLPRDERVIENTDDERRVIIPVEPDEALAALNEFLEDLNPDDLGRLITNAAEDLEGNGAHLNRALETVSGLVDSFARRDDELAAIVDNFDRFTATLVEREAQIGEVIDSFARTTAVLAEERRSLEALLGGLAQISQDGFDLIAEHSTALRTDVDTLARLGQSLVANLDAVTLLLDAGPLLAEGLADAFNPTLRAINLRTQFGPIAQVALEPVLQSIFGDDFQVPCVPLDTACSPLLPVAGQAGSVPVRTEVPAARTPIDDVLDLLATPSVPARRQPAASTADRVADGASAVGGWLRDAAEAVTGVDG